MQTSFLEKNKKNEKKVDLSSEESKSQLKEVLKDTKIQSQDLISKNPQAYMDLFINLFTDEDGALSQKLIQPQYKSLCSLLGTNALIIFPKDSLDHVYAKLFIIKYVELFNVKQTEALESKQKLEQKKSEENFKIFKTFQPKLNEIIDHIIPLKKEGASSKYIKDEVCNSPCYAEFLLATLKWSIASRFEVWGFATIYAREVGDAIKSLRGKFPSKVEEKLSLESICAQFLALQSNNKISDKGQAFELSKKLEKIASSIVELKKDIPLKFIEDEDIYISTIDFFISAIGWAVTSNSKKIIGNIAMNSYIQQVKGALSSLKENFPDQVKSSNFNFIESVNKEIKGEKAENPKQENSDSELSKKLSQIKFLKEINEEVKKFNVFQSNPNLHYLENRHFKLGESRDWWPDYVKDCSKLDDVKKLGIENISYEKLPKAFQKFLNSNQIKEDNWNNKTKENKNDVYELYQENGEEEKLNFM